MLDFSNMTQLGKTTFLVLVWIE